MNTRTCINAYIHTYRLSFICPSQKLTIREGRMSYISFFGHRFSMRFSRTEVSLADFAGTVWGNAIDSRKERVIEKKSNLMTKIDQNLV